MRWFSSLHFQLYIPHVPYIIRHYTIVTKRMLHFPEHALESMTLGELLFPSGHHYHYLQGDPLHILSHVIQESVPTESLPGTLLPTLAIYVKSYQCLCICYGLTGCDAHRSHAGILMSTVMVLGGGAFGRQLGHEGGVFMNRIRVLIKETPQGSVIHMRPCCHPVLTLIDSRTNFCCL